MSFNWTRNAKFIELCSDIILRMMIEDYESIQTSSELLAIDQNTKSMKKNGTVGRIERMWSHIFIIGKKKIKVTDIESKATLYNGTVENI